MLLFCILIIFVFFAGFNSSNAQQQSFEVYSEAVPGSNETIKMVPIKGGTFTMGSPESEAGRDNDEGPAQKVEVDSFWMGAYEITWAQYDLFAKEKLGDLKQQLATSGADIQADAISLPTPPYIDMSFGMGRDGFPAASMTQYAAIMYARWLTAKTGHFYRLPTEAEWEYACRAGSSTAYSYGNSVENLSEYAWYEGNSEGKYHPIGSKEPNEWGLYDMMGNVAEWTMDQYYTNYFDRLEGEPASNPLFLPDELYPRALRGGSWSHEAQELRCAERQGSDPKWKRRDPQLPKSRWWFTSQPFFGFRLVRPLEPPPPAERQKYWIEPIEDY